MATTIKIRGDSNSDEPVILVGRAQRPLTKITSLIRSRVIREVTLPIEGVSEEPDLVFTGELVAPSQLQQSQSVQLSANLFSQVSGGPLTVVEDYDPTHWDKAITSGGSSASLGGPNGDLLTATTTLGEVVVTFTYNVVGSGAQGTVATATIEVVAATTFNVVVTNLPASVIQGQSYTLGAERRDGVTGEVVDDDPANFMFAISVGGTFGSITNGNQLNVNPSTAGNSITVQATHGVGSESGQATTNIIVQPTFPNNEPTNLTQVAAFDGSTKVWSGWNPNTLWNDDVRLRVISDPTSKFGSVLEKRWYLNDSHGWFAVNERTFTSFRELYVRMVYILSDNYDFHGSGVEKLWYMRRRNGSGQIADGVFTVGHRQTEGLRLALNSSGGNGEIDGVPYASADLVSNGLGPTQRNAWYTVESLIRLNTPGNSDGSITVWRNGVQVPSWRWLGKGLDPDLRNGNKLLGGTAWDSYQINNIQTFLFWGGSGDVKGANDSLRLSEFYVSGRN